MSKEKPLIGKWMLTDSLDTDFGMIPHSIYKEPAFQHLSMAAQNFYIMLNVHKASSEQRNCLLSVADDYNKLLNLGLSKEDLLTEATPNKKTFPYSSGWFVIPASHLREMGYSLSRASKLKKELEEAGFIKVKYGGKGRYNGWNENVTIYQFSDEWKKKHFPI